MHNRYMTAKPGFFAKRVGSGYQNGWIFGKLPNGGIIFNPKIYVADFGPLCIFFGRFAKAVWNLSESSSVLVA